MAFTSALYYPWIDIRDEGWLKSAALYWDDIRTIVPESIARPYSTTTACAFQDEGILTPLRVQSDMREIEELTEDVLKYLDSVEATEFLMSDEIQAGVNIHMEKLPRGLRRLANIHPAKLSSEVQHALFDRRIIQDRDSEWLTIDARFADFYMTLLATRLSERVGTGLLTNIPASDRLAMTAKLDGSVRGRVRQIRRRRGEYDLFQPRRDVPATLAQGVLAKLILERIKIDPDTPISKIVEFRNDHTSELGQFRAKLGLLTESISSDLPIENLQQQVNDIYKNEVVPSMENFKKGLKNKKIKCVAETGLKIAFLSTSTFLLTSFGLSVPQALLAGAGVSLTAETVLYNINKRDSLTQNPYAYVLAAERAF